MGREDLILSFEPIDNKPGAVNAPLFYHVWGEIQYQSGIEVTNRSGQSGGGIGIIGTRLPSVVTGTIVVNDDIPLGTLTGPITEQLNGNFPLVQAGRTKESQVQLLKLMQGRLLRLDHRDITDRPGIVGTLQDITVIDNGQFENAYTVSFNFTELLGFENDGQEVELGTVFVPIRQVPIPSDNELGDEAPGSGPKECTAARVKTTIGAGKTFKVAGAALKAGSSLGWDVSTSTFNGIVEDVKSDISRSKKAAKLSFNFVKKTAGKATKLQLNMLDAIGIIERKTEVVGGDCAD